MDKLERVNNSISELISVIQEQHNEIETLKLSEVRSRHFIKLLLNLHISEQEKIQYCKEFDECKNETQVIELYNKILKKLKN